MSFGFGFGFPSLVATSGGPSLSLNYVGATTLDPQITFTRASAATYYNSSGLLTSAATNVPRFDYDPSTLAPQGQLMEEQRTNLLTYSSEFDNAAWNAKVTVTLAPGVSSPTGNLNAYTATATNVNSVLGQFVTSSIGTYTSSVWIKRRTGAGQIALSAGDNAPINVSVTSAWQRFSVTNTASTTTVRMYIHIAVSGDAIDVYGAQLEAGAFPTSYVPSTNTFTSRASTGTYFDSAGVLQSAAIDVARNTYNPANLAAAPFLLLEEARTNSIRNNTMVGAVAGTPGTSPTNWGVTGTANGLTRTISFGSENGIAYIDVRYAGTTTAASFSIIRPEATTQISASSGQTWTSSVYMRIAAGSSANTTDFQTWIVGADAGGTTTEAALTNTTLTGTMTRFSVTKTLNNASTAFVYPYTAFSYASGVAIDVTLRIGLPQLEQGYGATSVIPTTTAAATRAADLSSSAQATRAADVESINTLAPWFNATEGTLFVEASTFKTSGTAPTLTIQTAGGTSRHQTSIFTNAGATIDASVTQANIGTNVSQSSKTAYAYKTNDFAISVNGGTVATDTLGTVPSSLSYMTIGKFDFGGGESLSGYIRRIVYYPRRLSNAELQGITT